MSTLTRTSMETLEAIRTSLKRGVDYLNRFQRCLLQHTNTGTIQEISEISHPVSDLPVQGTAIWIVHSTHGVHCSGKGGEIDGHTQGYKIPPVPRRLVGEGQITSSLSLAYSGTSRDLSEVRLAGECSKIRAGSKASLPMWQNLQQKIQTLLS